MSTIFDLLLPQANAAAASATQTAIDTATQKPFSVIVSVDPQTQLWLTIVAMGGAAVALMIAARKK